MRIDLTVIVCTYNRSAMLLECLQSLVEQTIDPECFEVVVVNNNSTDATQVVAEAFCQEHINFKVVIEMEQGHSSARNRGWQEAAGQYVAYIDDDCLAEKNWCERILHAFTSVSPTATAVGGVIFPRYELEPPTWFSDQLEIRTWGDKPGFLQPPLGKYGFSGANMAFPRQLLETFGGFSHSFGIVDGVLKMGEDTDFFLRLHAAGKGSFWFDPAIVVSHWTPTEFFSIPFRLKRSYHCGRSHLGFETNPVGVGFFCRVLASVPIQLIKVVFSSVQPADQRTTYALRSFEKAAHQVGLLVECGRVLCCRWI